MPDEKLEHYFSKCKEVGIDAIIMECHSGKPVVLDSTSFRDSAALEIIRRAVPYAKKYGIELHAWKQKMIRNGIIITLIVFQT